MMTYHINSFNTEYCQWGRGSHHNDLFISPQAAFQGSHPSQYHSASSHLFIHPILAGHFSAGQVTPTNILDKCLPSQEVFIPPFQRQEDQFNDIGPAILGQLQHLSFSWMLPPARTVNSFNSQGNSNAASSLPCKDGLVLNLVLYCHDLSTICCQVFISKSSFYEWLNSSPSDKMDAILADDNFKCIFVMKMIEFRFGGAIWPHRPVLSLVCHLSFANTLTHWGWHNMAVIFQTTFSNAFCWLKMY